MQIFDFHYIKPIDQVWIFDLADGGARLLRLREGHSAPPSFIRFYGTDGQNILTAGQDSTVRSFSTVHDKNNKNLGRASYFKKASKRAGLKLDKYKMPPVVRFAAGMKETFHKQSLE
uniref:Uncharacterized protein n=1 Tax=Biomphalaria glabrata TaxID=6526 RepID=A0A2C9KX08_BIOGL